jgi:hypothetical protein
MFEDIKTKTSFVDKVCSSCKLCSEPFNNEFCFPTFVANKRPFTEIFVYAVLYDRGQKKDMTKFHELDTFKSLFCNKNGACLKGGHCRGGQQEACYLKFCRKDTAEEDEWSTYRVLIANRELAAAAASAEMNRTLPTTNHKRPTILSSERKVFLRKVEKILADRNCKQYRINKSPKSLKARAKKKTSDTKPTVSIRNPRRKKNVGNSKTDKSNGSEG